MIRSRGIVFTRGLTLALWMSGCAFLHSAHAEEDAGGWPFGARGAGARAGMGHDLYNLGLLGVKARDPARDPARAPAAVPAGGMRRGAAFERGGDDGPQALQVELLFPGGPADSAGLRVGDRIVGLGRSEFKEAALAPLAAALLKAEARDGLVELRVRRAGGDATEKVAVQIPSGGKAAGKPTKGAGRARIVERGLAWLAERQQPSGAFPATLSGLNGVVVQASLAGLAWLAGGSDDEQGPYATNVAAAAAFVAQNAGRRTSLGDGMEGLPGRGGRNWDQTNWGLAHAAIFLGELHARRPSSEVKRALIACGRSLAERQEASGGWAHGPGGPNALGYVELNIVTGLALCGLGLAQRAGYPVPEPVLERAGAYLEASSAGDGGVGYSHQPGQRGQGNIGRTAGSWLGYETLGLGRTGWGQKMRKWTARNAGAVFGGHASLMQHVLLAGLAAHALGGKAQKAFWDGVERDLVLARAPDGSLQPRPWHESLSIGSNSDVTFGEVWTTAAWTLVLACAPEKGVRPGLPGWLGLLPPAKRKR